MLGLRLRSLLKWGNLSFLYTGDRIAYNFTLELGVTAHVRWFVKCWWIVWDAGTERGCGDAERAL